MSIRELIEDAFIGDDTKCKWRDLYLDERKISIESRGEEQKTFYQEQGCHLCDGYDTTCHYNPLYRAALKLNCNKNFRNLD